MRCKARQLYNDEEKILTAIDAGTSLRAYGSRPLAQLAAYHTASLRPEDVAIIGLTLLHFDAPLPLQPPTLALIISGGAYIMLERFSRSHHAI